MGIKINKKRNMPTEWERSVHAKVSEWYPRNKAKMLENVPFNGFIPWAAAHAESPEMTVRLLQNAEMYASLMHLMIEFAESALVKMDMADRFKYLTTFRVLLRGTRDEAQSSLKRSKEDVQSCAFGGYKAFVAQLSIFDGKDGGSQTATLWIENGTIEVFNPWEHKSKVLDKIADQKIAPFLMRQPFGQGITNVVNYTLPSNWVYSNLWNPYFLMLRATHGRKEVQRFFSNASSLTSLIENRNLTIQTSLKLMTLCAEASAFGEGKEHMRALFGRDSEPMNLTEGKVNSVIKIVRRCNLSRNPLWDTLREVAPSSSGDTDNATGGDFEFPADTPKKWDSFRHVPGAKMPLFDVE